MVQQQPDSGTQLSVDRARLAAIVECSDDAIISKTLDGIIQTWNAGAERIFGFTAAEAVGKSITLIIPPDRADEEARILEQLRGGLRVDHYETVRQTKSGRLIEISATISPVRDESGNIVGLSKVARDITLQKQFEQQLQTARQAAEHANQAKDDFISMLSHELRTPLTPALAALNMLAQDAGISAAVQEQLAMVRRNVELEARLVDDLLDLTRIARGKIQIHTEPVEAHAIVQQVTDMLGSQIKTKNLKLTMSLEARESHIMADPARFQQILLNLFSNAIKFTPTGGAITVKTANENGRFRVDVIDTGIGIQPDMMARLFRPFEQGENMLSRRFGGLGLGLSIVKSLVELHDGSVSASSDGEGKGAKLTIQMPTVAAQSTKAKPPAAPPAPLAATRVLLVEDHDDTRKVMARVLMNGGCKVTTAANVRDAIQAADAQRFDLLLSDLGLPDGTGHQVMQHMAIKFKTPGIALSGFGQESDIARSHEAGFSVHLTKPVSLQTLLSSIAEVTSKSKQ